MTWRASSHAKYDCKYHLVWCPKRRRLLRDPVVRASVVKTFRAVAAEFGFWIDELAVARDHVHVFLEFPPKYAIARVVGVLKSISASRTFDRFPELRRKFWSGELWEDGYAARTVSPFLRFPVLPRLGARCLFFLIRSSRLLAQGSIFPMGHWSFFNWAGSCDTPP